MSLRLMAPNEWQMMGVPNDAGPNDAANDAGGNDAGAPK